MRLANLFGNAGKALALSPSENKTDTGMLDQNTVLADETDISQALRFSTYYPNCSIDQSLFR